ncbi:palmitoyltransferase ZDHHC23 isoform X2 [Octopus bimaculoides]|uniref:Palmitoyltransferase n=1 Tax=Octopus bimaculoides TaxID=37653 RepID=A0A0L8HL13_OCTBM|nr:palmitoyltransferase ZDHHC23 isoform X2 [Octopus bimaculoides]|eukprot:XP_014771463.1 PREDICTED: palmitoyltransferase ZDHHC23-like isoform X2 [Octopus bimaculoides]
MTDQTILCCCEYINKSGERSHMLACCCDCEDLDKACDNCLCCKEIPSDTMRNITTTISDRCRIPWCCGHGAIQTKKQPGILMKPNLTASKLNENESHNIQVDTSVMIPAGEITWIDSRPIEGLYLVTWCGFCNNRKPPRSGHCYVCSSCVSVRDHHCVWIDNCIGANNHRIFIVCMIFFLFCGLYGSHLTFTTVCTPEMYFNWILFPNDCRFIYSDFQTSISFVTACYVSISTAVMLLAFLQQILLISQNITSQELHQALVRKKTFCGIYAYNNVHNKGFLHNWMEFIFRPSRSISQKIPM